MDLQIHFPLQYSSVLYMNIEDGLQIKLYGP